ncbi:MAG: FAD-binding oxidoreductase [Gammaproteobacteria bacterium AqS3]|nr:FAD-binding oxidoreductase [Gammaproteobacteria bacterium AqS3]
MSSALTELAQLLVQQLGEDGVVRDDETLERYSQDIYSHGAPIGLLVRPAGLEQLAETVRLATSRRVRVLPRGAGMSYTGGYLSDGAAPALLVDLSCMNRVLDIDEENMIVRVECGCSWQELHRALSARGLRTTYWGTLSGAGATVGGGLSNNSIFWGSGRFGSAADNVLGLQVVIGDGSVLQTGAAAQQNASSSFMRQFGPDLTGLFLCDCGALGIKAVAELPLMREYPHHAYASFDFPDADALLCAMAEISRTGLISELFGFDPELQRQRLRRASLAEDLSMAAGVLKSSRLLQGFGSLIKLGLHGRRFAEDTTHTLHCIASEHTAEGARHAIQQARRIVARCGGRGIADSIPRVMRANPFPPLNNISGALGERWAPVHGLFPHSDAVRAYQRILELFAGHAATMQRHGITTGCLFTAIGSRVSVLEPVFYWQDALQSLHRHTMDDSVLKVMPGFDENLEGRAAVDAIRSELSELMCELGAVHLQIGRTYRYREAMPEANRNLLMQLKRHLDPEDLINPGVLGR